MFFEITNAHSRRLKKMAQFHFVEDYEKLVAALVNRYPIEQAMSLAVGGF